MIVEFMIGAAIMGLFIYMMRNMGNHWSDDEWEDEDDDKK